MKLSLSRVTPRVVQLRMSEGEKRLLANNERQEEESKAIAKKHRKQAIRFLGTLKHEQNITTPFETGVHKEVFKLYPDVPKPIVKLALTIWAREPGYQFNKQRV